MLIVRYELSNGTLGEDKVLAGDKWIFGRPGGEETPTVGLDDRRISRSALVIRDSGPGPVVFRGQRGDGASVVLRSVDGSEQWLEEGTAGHLTHEARSVEMHLDDQHVITLEVEFSDRPSVRRQPHDDAADDEDEQATSVQPAVAPDQSPDQPRP